MCGRYHFRAGRLFYCRQHFPAMMLFLRPASLCSLRRYSWWCPNEQPSVSQPSHCQLDSLQPETESLRGDGPCFRPTATSAGTWLWRSRTERSTAGIGHCRDDSRLITCQALGYSDGVTWRKRFTVVVRWMFRGNKVLMLAQVVSFTFRPTLLQRASKVAICCREPVYCGSLRLPLRLCNLIKVKKIFHCT